MIYNVARISIALLLITLLAAPSPALAQTSTEEQKKEEQKKQEQNKDQKKPKNSDIENIGNRDINKGLSQMNFTSLEKEIALGRQLAAEIERQVKLVEDPVISEYVNRVGQNLVRNSDAKVPFTIKVVESDEINAFALPGGFFYVNSGLILAADDESELAGVMAHEIAHVTARHGTEQATKGQIVNMATLPLIFLGGAAGYGLRQAAGFLIPMQFLKFGRDAEAEADFLGLQYLYKTGYDPSASVSFFEKLQARESAKPGSINKMFSSHPPTEDRIEKTKKNIEIVLPDKDEYVVTTSEFQKIKMQLAALENRKPAEESNKPSLRRKTSKTDTDAQDKDDKDKDKKETKPEDREPEKDERPTLKRKPGGVGGF
ncbi:MAG: M48 family metalloprotease [Acidobacteria bacterium]|nr:M48 family metalloprotease [Acidobacteriota bacterium]